jgi:antitoxin (DNA-binding transcriptional repressor) of toxin-antitoxin stability system
MNVSLEEIKQHPSEYLDRVIEGETVVVYRQDKPIAEIRPVPQSRALRPIGLAAGEFVVPDDFDEPLPDEILDEFEGR